VGYVQPLKLDFFNYVKLCPMLTNAGMYHIPPNKKPTIYKRTRTILSVSELNLELFYGTIKQALI
jgi:hypothetical protein